MDLKSKFSKANHLYLITDTHTSQLTHVQMACHALRAGIRIIQLREKNMTRKDIFKQALQLRKIAVEYDALFIVNDYIDIALAAGSDGVHIGQEDMPIAEARKIMGKNAIIGVSTHSLKQAMDAENGGADYIGFGPVFHTRTKDAGSPRGVKMLEKIRKSIKIPVVAIGGITWENVSIVLNSGADACAVSSGILSGDITENVEDYFAAVRTACPFLHSAGVFRQSL